MSYSSNLGRGDRAGPAPVRRSPVGDPPAGAPLAGYTIGFGNRHFQLKSAAFWAMLATVATLTVWSAASIAYFTFHDEVLASLISRQAEMQYAYENRVADLKGQLDGLTSRHVLEQEQFEYKLDQVMRRQSALEARAAALSGVPATAGTSPTRPPAAAPEQLPTIVKPSPIGEPAVRIPTRGDRGAWLAPQTRAARNTAAIDSSLRALQDSLDLVEARQTAAVNGLAETYDAKARRMRGVLSDLGLDVARVPPSPNPAVGGPLVPVTPRGDASPFERQLHRVNIARAQLERLNQALDAVPVRKPVAGEVETTSGFGVRLDPFIRAPAMHTGVDFRANVGEEVRATAAGKVMSAGWSGGYGKMIEIDHGNGFSTRYGHLSSIRVEEGQTIRLGQVIGRVGTTGRSTGPHLHYETRVDGEAVDPQRFLRAALRLDTPL
jgi:murein DD-endopeptidase MepM/ murein hydrolase activator NlpD